jgi:hypothetical protein
MPAPARLPPAGRAPHRRMRPRPTGHQVGPGANSRTIRTRRTSCSRVEINRFPSEGLATGTFPPEVCSHEQVAGIPGSTATPAARPAPGTKTLCTELEQLVERHGPTGTSKITSPNTLTSRSKVSCGVLPTAPLAALDGCPRVAAAPPEELRSPEEVPQIVGADERALIPLRTRCRAGVRTRANPHLSSPPSHSTAAPRTRASTLRGIPEVDPLKDGPLRGVEHRLDARILSQHPQRRDSAARPFAQPPTRLARVPSHSGGGRRKRIPRSSPRGSLARGASGFQMNL